MNLATHQCAQRRDRTNDYMCHLDHLLQLPWARRKRVPPTEAARRKMITRSRVVVARLDIFKAWGLGLSLGCRTRARSVKQSRSREYWAGIRHVQCRNEQGASLMADGYTRATGKPGVCTIIAGPGVTNAATGIAQAYCDSLIEVRENSPWLMG